MINKEILKSMGLIIKPNKENINHKNYDYCGSFFDENIIVDVYTEPHKCKSLDITTLRLRMFNDDIPYESVYKIREVLSNYYNKHPYLIGKNKQNLLYQVLSNEIIAQISNYDLTEILATIKSIILNRDCNIRENKSCECEQCRYLNKLPASYLIK